MEKGDCPCPLTETIICAGVKSESAYSGVFLIAKTELNHNNMVVAIIKNRLRHEKFINFSIMKTPRFIGSNLTFCLCKGCGELKISNFIFFKNTLILLTYINLFNTMK